MKSQPKSPMNALSGLAFDANLMRGTAKTHVRSATGPLVILTLFSSVVAAIPPKDVTPHGTEVETDRLTSSESNTGAGAPVGGPSFLNIELFIETENGFAKASRCVSFTLLNCDPLESHDFQLVLDLVHGAATIEMLSIPQGDWDSISAKDELHTLRRTVPLKQLGNEFSADFTGANALISGDADNDNLVYLADHCIYQTQIGHVDPNTACEDVPPPPFHPDFNGDSVVNVFDFSPILIHYFENGDEVDAVCASSSLPLSDRSGSTDVSMTTSGNYSGALTGRQSGRVSIQSMGPGPCGPATDGKLVLDSDMPCYEPGEQVNVTLTIREQPGPVHLGGFFLQYDPDRLQFLNAISGDPPFNSVVFLYVDETSGAIEYVAGSDPIGPPNGTLDETIIVTLIFTAIGPAYCADPTLVRFNLDAVLPNSVFPESCEELFPSLQNLIGADCNNNDIPDECELKGNDCDGDGVPDECEIDKNSKAPGGPFFCNKSCDPDCNENGIPDGCDIAECPPNTTTCADCNLNGVPDLCDVPSSTGCPTGSCAENCSMDSDEDCVPDECSFWNPPKVPQDEFWFNPENWDPQEVPDNSGEETFSVNIEGKVTNVILNMDSAIDTLQLIDGPTLNITGGDLTIETEAGVLNHGLLLIDGDHSMNAGKGNFVTIGCSAGPLVGCFPPRGTSVANAGFMSALSISVLQGAFIHLADEAQVESVTSLNLVNGMYQADPMAALPTSACTSAGSVLITNEPAGRGHMILEDTMSVSTSGDFTLSPSLECQADDIPPDECPPPRLEVFDEATLHIGGAFIVANGSEVIIDGLGGIASRCTGVSGQGSVSAVTLSGDFINRGKDPSRFDWVNGSLALDGMERTFEVAGMDLGPGEAGFVTNFAMGTLTVAGGANINFVDDFENSGSPSDALYVNTFILGKGATAVFSAGAVYSQRFVNEGGFICEEGGVFFCECTSDLDVCTCDTCENGSCQHKLSAYGNASCDAAGVVDLDDILCVIAGFGDIAACPNGDVAPPCTGDSLIDLDDILGVIGAFGGADPCLCGG